MIGQTLAHYEITGKLGQGGMGEVYRARDTKLGRDVALKMLTPAFASDPERVARFQREARTLAALNHANIAGIYGFEEDHSHRFLVMELVEGEDLSERLAKGPIPLTEALQFARQVADGLEDAHEQGIVHRDLKPANIKITPDGKAKILDFGLARAFQGQTVDEGTMENSPTITAGMTRPGVILGSAAYMAPEQAKGKTVDRRADLWAFGVILWEMLTGRRLFQGEDISDTLAAVLRDEPDWDQLPAETPLAVRRLLERCIERDPRKRLRDIGEARVRLEQWTADPSTMMEAPGDLPEIRIETSPLAKLPWALAIVAVALAIWGWLPRGTTDAPPPTASFELDLRLAAEDQLRDNNGTNLQFSPDGNLLAYLAADGIHLRWLDRREEQVLTGTDAAGQFTFSPDGTWIAFAKRGRLLRVSITGGAPIDICEAGDPRGLAWVNPATIVFSPTFTTPLEQVDLGTGIVQPLTTLDADAGERTHRWPVALPDGNSVLYSCQYTNRQYDEGDLRIVTLDGEQTTVHRGGANPRYAESGHLLFVRDGTLFAVPFDLKAKLTSGLAVPLVSSVWASVDDQQSDDGSAQYCVSRDGKLIYRTAGNRASGFQIVYQDLESGVTTPLSDPGNYTNLLLSPDGLTLAADTDDVTSEIYLIDTQSGIRTRFTFSPEADILGTWSPDSSQLYWQRSSGDGTFSILTRPADGSSPESIVHSAEYNLYPTSCSPDGNLLLINQWRPPDMWDLVTLDLANPAASLTFLAGGPTQELWATFSPDGKWFSYYSDNSGEFELYARPYPDTGAQWRVGATARYDTLPIWADDGLSIFFRDENGFQRVPIEAKGAGLRVGRPALIRGDDFYRAGGNWTSAIHSNGKSAYFVQALESDDNEVRLPQVVLVTDLHRKLSQLAPTR